MALSKSLKKLSAKLIAKFGNDLTLSKITQGDYIPSLGKSEESIIKIITKGVDKDYLGEHSSTGDMKITFVSDVAVDAFDKCVYRGKEREIINIQEVGMENLTIIYEIIVTGDAREQV